MITAYELSRRRHGQRLPCAACGTWTCAACGWQRYGAALARPELQDCAACGSTRGTLVPSAHYKQRIWDDHNPVTATAPHPLAPSTRIPKLATPTPPSFRHPAGV